MAATPFYSVILKETGEDISRLISKLSHELAVDVDNLLMLEFNTNNSQNFERKNLVEGNTLLFQYGFLGGKVSPKYIARISDVLPVYAKIVTIKILATDLGISLKKDKSKKIWSNVSSADIVNEIAETNGLNAEVDDGTTTHKFMPQGNRTDYDFLKYLANIEKDGSFFFMLSGDAIVFKKKDLTKTSIRTFTYGDGDGEIISFKPSSKETSKKGSSRNTVVNSVNPFTNEVIQESVDNTNSKDDVKLGDFGFHYNQTGELVDKTTPSKAQKQKEDPNRAGGNIDVPVTSAEEASNVANKEKKDEALNDLTANLLVNGNPDYIFDEIITMAGVQKREIGNWYTKRSTHNVQMGDSYKVRLSMQKNAIAKAIISDDTAQTNTNKTTGPESGDSKKEVKLRLYDGDGVEIED